MPMPRTFWLFILACFVLVALMEAGNAQGPSSTREQMQDKPMKDIRFVVFHTSGPKWLPGKNAFEQPGIQEHVGHYKKLLEAGKLALGGPHLDGKGGDMMIPTAEVTEDEITKYAAEDLAVKSGLLVAEVRPWLIGMNK